jgi:hypothetical protein
MDERDYKAMNEELNPPNANNVLAVVAFIEAEIPKIEAERNKYIEPYNHSMYINTDRRLNAAKLFLEWVVSNYP